MATKSYSKHKEYKEFSSSGAAPFAGEQFDMLKSELIPAGSKLNTISSTGANGGHREYHYEYREEKLPHGKYDRKDLHTVEEYTVPPKSSESNAYYYEREERALPAITSGTRTYNYETSASSTPGYSKVKSSKVTKDLSHNVEELDSLLDDLQKDQERQLYKSGYTSDTAETSSFDYKRGNSTPVKAPSSGYSTLKREERVESSSWGSSPPPPVTRSSELRQEMFREEKTESRVVPALLSPVAPAPACTHCHHQTSSSTGTLTRTGAPMNKVTTTVKTYTYEVPADQDPASVPLPARADSHHTYVSENENVRTLSRSTARSASPASPAGCAHCQHCNTGTRVRRDIYATDVSEHSSERVAYPAPADVTLQPAAPPAPLVTHLAPERNGHGPYGPTTYKYSETTYSSHNSRERAPPSPAPFPRATTPAPRDQPPTRLDDLLADFPEARFPTQPDGVVRRKVEVTHESSTQGSAPTPTATAKAPAVGSKNVAGPAVYYPPGHTPFAKKDTPVAYQASSAAMQGGGAYASGRGMYEYESGSRSKEKHSEKKTAVPICLPLCCAMPCVIM